MLAREIPIIFNCGPDELVGIIHQSDETDLGVVVIVGGPQYRVGSHRQFVLLARALAKNGVPTFRFDYRGMGDSDGGLRDFNDVESDLNAAIDFFIDRSPGVKKIILWGLCDAASASCFYAYKDPRVVGLVLLNPWVRTTTGEAKAYLKHYYVSRLLSKEMWKKIFGGKFNLTDSIKSLFRMFVTIIVGNKAGGHGKLEIGSGICDSGSLPERMLCGLREFNGKVLLILSGDDLTADEFRDLVASSSDWKNILGRPTTTQHTLQEANHTFSSQEWRQQVERWTCQWIDTIKN